MTREQALQAIEQWNPEGADLSDDVARWIGEDDAVAAAFEARFEPIVDDETLAVPDGLEQRLVAQVTRARPPRWVPVVVAIAATAVLTVAGLGTLTLTSLQPEMAPVSTQSEPASLIVKAEEGRYGVNDPTPVPLPSPVPAPAPAPMQVNSQQEAVGHVDRPDESGEREVDGYMGMPDDLFDGGNYMPKPKPKPQVEPKPPDFRLYSTAPVDAGVPGGKQQARREVRETVENGRWEDAPPADHRVMVTSARVQILEKVQFGEASAEPSPASGPILDAVAEVLRERPELEIEVAGHADMLEAEAGILATARANAVRKALVERGVRGEQLVPVGYADGRPIAGTPGSSMNRRTEFRILTHEPAPRSDPTSGEDYKDYGHHAFVHTNEDPLSTFSIDVDTASYSVTRRKLTEGFLPPTASVRVEEFLNAMRYDYAAPHNEPFSVSFEGAPNPFNPRTHMVRIGVQGKKIAASERKPANLVFLVDTSGSMSSRDKLGLVQESLRMLTEELRDGDTVSIVAYAGSAGVVLEPTPISRRAEILRAIDRLRSGGSTAMGQGIQLAYQLAESGRSNGAISRVIIASDGDANVGRVHHSQLSQLIREHALNGVTLTTLGFGTGNYQDTTMEQLANDGDGNYYYIDTRDEARKVLVDRLTSTIQVIARDVKIQVEFDDDAVIAYRLVGYENRDIADRDFRNDAVDAGEVGAGHQVTALYEVALRPGASGDLATLRMRAKAPGPDAPASERAWTLPVEGLRSELAESSPDFRIALGAASFAELLRRSPHIHGASFRDVGRIVESALRPEYDEDRELLGLIYRAEQLSR